MRNGGSFVSKAGAGIGSGVFGFGIIVPGFIRFGNALRKPAQLFPKGILLGLR